jgi:hypothetical protein
MYLKCSYKLGWQKLEEAGSSCSAQKGICDGGYMCKVGDLVWVRIPAGGW